MPVGESLHQAASRMSQLWKSSRTPSHTISRCVFNNVRSRVIFTSELASTSSPFSPTVSDESRPEGDDVRTKQNPAVRSGAVLVMLASFGLATPEAWGVQGHRLAALIAADQLNSTARLHIAWLLADSNLADIAVWADDYVADNSQTGPWHYVNLPADATAYDRERDCPRQPHLFAGSRNDRWRDCVVDWILYHQARVAETSLDRADRATAPKFLDHLIGDLPQPSMRSTSLAAATTFLSSHSGRLHAPARTERLLYAISTAFGIRR
jgi:S1/P1 Nuclease